MAKITFILGGARSGKSSYAARLAGKNAKNIAFIATCQPLDEEMKERIRRHRKNRPKKWQTLEEPIAVLPLLKKVSAKFDLILIDCLTLLVSNMLLAGWKEKKIKKEIKDILSVLKKTKSIIVSNEVGLGIVPDNKLSRDFRDIAGRINQIIAANADEVFFMVSGIPWRIK